MHLRRRVGWRRLRHSQRPRHSHRHRRRAQGDQHSQSPLACGCYADEYHWRDGIGPRDQRARTINSLWGGVVENHHFGTHEFLDLCDQLSGSEDDAVGGKCEPYIAGNVGSGTVREMQEWIQYMTYDSDSDLANERRKNGRDEPWKIKFFGVGNENWGCGGGMHPEYYADEYRKYAEFCRNYSGNELYKVACGANGRDERWTRVMMEKVGRRMNGLSLHYYTTDWNNKGSATDFDVDRYFDTLRRSLQMDEIVTRHDEVMLERDPDRRIPLVVDEWGTWFDVEPGTNPGFLYQQNTVRDALVAGITLNIFHDHARRVKIANLAQLVNVLQAPILTDGPKMVLTPTYHVLEMYQVHQDAMRQDCEIACPHYTRDRSDLDQLHASASRDADGKLHVSMVNLHHEEPLDVNLKLAAAATSSSGRIITSETIQSMNTFDAPETVMPGDLDGIEVNGDTLKVTLPAHSVATIGIE